MVHNRTESHSAIGGYIALMATIIISAILLILCVEGSLAGFHARFSILGTEAKEQATALAEGCADQALSAVVTDPTYTGHSTTTTAVGTCYVFPIIYNVPLAGMVTILVQSRVRGSFVNLEMQMNMSDIHTEIPQGTTTRGTLVIATTVVNGGSGTSSPADFLMQVQGTAVSSSTFTGSVRGQTVTVDEGSYEVTGALVDHYRQTTTPSCRGTVVAGAIVFCTITYTYISTTLAVLTVVENDVGGVLDASEVTVTVDGTVVQSGRLVPVSPGVHTVAVASVWPDYEASIWGLDCGADGRVQVSAGESKACSVTLSDIPPVPLCTETVLLLDRTTNMSASDREQERLASELFLDLFTRVTNPLVAARIAVGSISGVAGESASIPVLGQLALASNNQRSVTAQITDSAGMGGTDVAAGLAVATAEFTSPRHVPGAPKALVLVSNGVPTLPTSTDPFTTALQSADALKLSDTTIYAVHIGADPGPLAGKNFLAQLASGSTSVSGHAAGAESNGMDSVTGSTGFVSPTTATATTGGDTNGFELNPEKALTDGAPAGLAGAAHNRDGAFDRHVYAGYEFTLPPGATITGIQVRADWWLDSTAGTNSLGIELSGDGGSTWTSMRTDGSESTSTDASALIGGATDRWGRVWSVNDLRSDTFMLRLTMQASQATRDFYLDWIPVAVFYSATSENADMDSLYVAQSATDLPEIFSSIGARICPAARVRMPTVLPTNGVVYVVAEVVNDNGGVLAAGAVPLVVSPATALPRTLTSTSVGTSVIVPPGSYTIKSSAIPSGYTETRGVGCSGVMRAGQSEVCVLTYDDIPPPPVAPDMSIHLGSWKELPVARQH